MNIGQLINRIRNRTATQPDLTDDVVLKFVHVLEHIEDEDLSCADIYTILDEFVENEVAGGDKHKLSPLIHEHLDLCSECCDEYEALLAVVENTGADKIK